MYSEMIFVHGFVHCDPHPGNVLVRKGPESNKTEIVLLDHGLYQVRHRLKRRTLRFITYYTPLFTRRLLGCVCMRCKLKAFHLSVPKAVVCVRNGTFPTTNRYANAHKLCANESH